MAARQEQYDSPPNLRRRHIAAATIGNALEFYDFLTYVFFDQIGRAFFPAQSAYGSLMLSLATFGAGFVTRPIGAIVIGVYSDRAGRKPAMMLCFVLIGLSIVGITLVPTYAAIGSDVLLGRRDPITAGVDPEHDHSRRNLQFHCGIIPGRVG
jgi:MFS family permease